RAHDHPDSNPGAPAPHRHQRRARTRRDGPVSPRGPKGELISDPYRIQDPLGSGGESGGFRPTATNPPRAGALQIPPHPPPRPHPARGVSGPSPPGGPPPPPSLPPPHSPSSPPRGSIRPATTS